MTAPHIYNFFLPFKSYNLAIRECTFYEVLSTRHVHSHLEDITVQNGKNIMPFTSLLNMLVRMYFRPDIHQNCLRTLIPKRLWILYTEFRILGMQV
jgi:hypothetical protein